MIAAPVGELVDHGRIPVVGEDHRPIDREQRIELRILQAVRMFGVRLQRHQVDHIDHPHADVGHVLAQQRDRRERLERGHVARAGHHDVGTALVIAGP